MLSYEDWYDYNWDKLQEQYDNYCTHCAKYEQDIDSWEDFLSDEYESYVSEFECRAYDEYKDGLL